MPITTGVVRASYVNIFQPRASQNGGDPKYSVTLLIPKNDTATINGIYAEIEKAKQEGAQRVFGGSIPPMCKTPIYDGDGVRPSGEPFGEECRGCLVMTASAKQLSSSSDKPRGRGAADSQGIRGRGLWQGQCPWYGARAGMDAGAAHADACTGGVPTAAGTVPTASNIPTTADNVPAADTGHSTVHAAACPAG